MIDKIKKSYNSFIDILTVLLIDYFIFPIMAGIIADKLGIERPEAKEKRANWSLTLKREYIDD